MCIAQLFRNSTRWLIGLTLFSVAQGSALADVKLPNIFSDHMVLQRDQKDKVWGLAEPGVSVTVSIAQQKQRTVADAAGQWHLFLEPLPAGGPHTLTVKGKNEITCRDVLVGEVWICAGQSNMEWAVKETTDPDLEILAAKYPKIRMINYPNLGSQEPVWTHDAQWHVCSPQTVGEFSAVGYFFARQLYQTLAMSKLPNTGQAVIIDKGESQEGHSPHKLDVGRRLARWALANDYGIDNAHRSPQYKSMQQGGNKIVLTFDYVGSGWRPFDVAKPRGFAIAGEDNKFVHAQARILPDKRIEVWSDAVTKPLNVRYGWADNPVVNMYNNDGLPLTPFRTDDLPCVTAGRDF